MTLGPDGTVCTTELAEAMRTRLDLLDPPAGANVDLAEVRENFAALGAGLHSVLTTKAQTATSAAQDAAFWAWVNGVSARVGEVLAWQAGVRAAVTAWTPADLPGQALRTAILGLPVPAGAVPAVPTSLSGVLR
jgi:hypothetical protein